MKPNEQGKKKLEDTASEQLTDLRFTGHGSPKVVCMVGEEDKHASWSQSKLVVCTDQGTVYQYSDRQWEIVWKGTPEFQSYCLMETTTVSLKDSVMCLCAVGNLSGSIQVFPISHPQCGVRLTGGTGKIHSLIWRETKDGIYLLASGSEGLVFRWLIEVPSQENAPSSLRVNPLPSFLLPRGAKRWLTAAVRVHANAQGGLWVCGDRRGSLLLFQDGGTQEAVDHRRPDDCPLTGRKPTHRHEVEERAPGGDRKSERKEVADSLLQPLSCLFGVHGKLGVTSVSEHQGLLYSTGRDGCVRVFRLILVAPQKREGKSNGNSVENNGGLQLEVLRVQRACKGMEWLERVLILDSEISAEEEDLLEKEFENHYKTTTLAGKMEVTGAREEKERFKGEEENTEDNGREARFAIIGFHAVHFVVWDPVRQQRLFAVPCGGGHRSWRLWPSHRGGGGVWPGYGALVFIKQGAVMASRPPGEASGRAGEVGRYEGWGLREGVHGRGIGCVCRLGAITGIISDVKEAQRGEERWEIVATGGEDTSLTVLALRPSCGRVKVLSVITDHISSVRTLTAVTGPGGGREDQALSALLVSAGGRAQMQCYRLRVGWDRRRLVPSCQVIQVASHRLDEQWERRRNRHKTVKMDPETRYMSVVAVDEKTDGCLLAVACSDGAVRLFSVSEVKHQIDLLWETFYHQRCVLSVAACSLQDRKCNKYKLLFSAATDGQIAVWDLTDASSLWTGASSRSPTAPIPCFSIHAHQSGVNSLAVRADNLGPPEYGCRVTVASGGDDGQLTVSMIRVQYPNDSPISEPLVSPQAQFRSAEQLHLSLDSQCRIPLAHASPLTALKLLSQNLVVSTSSDQRVCLWRVGSTDISHIGALCCHVADAAGLAVWEGKLTEEEEDKHKKTGLQSEREIAIRPGGPAGLNETHQTAARFNKDQETNDVGVSETGDPVCQTSNEGGGETERRHQRGADSSGETESEVNTERGVTASWESRGGKTGWVLVCGHGFQLLRVPNAEGGSSRREKQQEDQSLASREKSK